MVLIRSRTLASPSATIFSGVSAAANSAGVALLTPASVACADKTTATSSVYGLMCCSSPRGSGSALWKRRKTSSISAAVQGLDFVFAVALPSGRGGVADLTDLAIFAGARVVLRAVALTLPGVVLL